jgi:hypothetical protein
MGKTLTLWVRGDGKETVLDVKKQILEKEGIPISACQLIGAGKLLVNGRTLSDYNLGDGCDHTVHFVPRGRIKLSAEVAIDQAQVLKNMNKFDPAEVLSEAAASLFSSRKFVSAAFDIAPAEVFAHVVDARASHFSKWEPSNFWSRSLGEHTGAVVHTSLLVGARIEALPNELWSDVILRFVPWSVFVTDHAIALDIIGTRESAMIKHPLFDKALLEDKHFAIAAVSQNDGALEHFADHMQADPDVASAAASAPRGAVIWVRTG